MKEGGNFIPNKKDRWSEPKEKLLSPERRNFLGALAGFGATLAASGGALKYLEAMEKLPPDPKESIPFRERLVDDVVKAVGANLRSPDILEALKGKGHDPLGRILRAAEYPILPEHVAGTTYDVTEISQKYQTQIAISSDPSGKRRLAERVAVHAAANSTEDAHLLLPEEGGYANASYWSDRNLLITCGHVVPVLYPDKKEYARMPVDVALLRVPSRLAAPDTRRVISLDSIPPDENLHGRYFAIRGYDPDATAGEGGAKLYPGVAIKVTKEIIPFILQAIPNAGATAPYKLKQLENSYMFILPPGEGKRDKQTGALPAMGMSGSAVYAKAERTFSFGGIFWAATEVEIGNTCQSIGFIHGSKEILEATKETKVVFIPER